jgi:hypothetical protein
MRSGCLARKHRVRQRPDPTSISRRSSPFVRECKRSSPRAGNSKVSLGRPVDLIDLETVSPVLAIQVVRHGRLVREHDASHSVRFVATLPGRYEDVMLMRRPAEKLLLMRLGNGRA